MCIDIAGGSGSSGDVELTYYVDPGDDVELDADDFWDLFDEESREDFEYLEFYSYDDFDDYGYFEAEDADGDWVQLYDSTLDDGYYYYNWYDTSSSYDYALDRMTFCADKNADEDTLEFPFTMYGDDNDEVGGTLYIEIGEGTGTSSKADFVYQVDPDDDVTLDAEDFYDFFYDESDYDELEYIEFTGYDDFDDYGYFGADGYDYDDYEEEPPRRRQSSSGGNNKKTMMVVLGILAAFLIVALSIGIAAIFRSCTTQPDDTMTMPNLVGQLYTDVQNNEEYAFKFSVETREDSSQETGIILDQTPAAGMSVKKDGEVLLVVNSGAKTINVPDVTNYLQADAEQTLQNAGFETTVIEVPDDKIAAGYVTSTEPKGNATAPEGSTVKILVSTGPENEQIAVPNVIDKNIEAARTEIEAAGLQVGDVTLQDDSDKPENTVIETNPLPGVPVDPDTKVNIVVSSGKQSEKTLEANVHLPLNVSHDIELKAYLDGTVMEDGVRTVNPAYNNLCTIKVTGTSGQKTLVIELDGNKYAVFIMDFDTGKPSQVESYPYVDPGSPSSDTPGTDTEEDWGDIPTDLPITPTE